MGYVDESLMAGEQVVWRGRQHWLAALALPLNLIVGGLLLLVLGAGGAALLVLVLGLVVLAPVWMGWKAQDFAVTTRRVIAKRGLLGHQVAEMPVRQAESTNVSQGLYARIWNYGSVIAAGTGGTKVVFVNVMGPMELRRTIQQQAADAQLAQTAPVRRRLHAPHPMAV